MNPKKESKPLNPPVLSPNALTLPELQARYAALRAKYDALREVALQVCDEIEDEDSNPATALIGFAEAFEELLETEIWSCSVCGATQVIGPHHGACEHGIEKFTQLTFEPDPDTGAYGAVKKR